MENIAEYIDKTLSECNDKITNNLLGVNYLENLKYLLIDSLKKYEINLNQIKEKYEIKREFNQYNFIISLEKFDESISKIKKIIENDTLSIVLIGSKSVEIYENSNSQKSILLNLNKNNGIVIPQHTIFNELINKDTILMDITIIMNKDIDQQLI